MEKVQKVHRVLVHLRKEHEALRCVGFLQSVTGFFSSDDQAMVRCSLDNNQFILSSGEGGTTPLKRPSCCPFKQLSVSQAVALPLDVQQRGVDVGVAVLLQSANQRVLLTRRAATLPIFPNVWVPPGGHVELDETLLATGLRELQEETGVKLEEEDVSAEILGLWESAYPPFLSRGTPLRHHIVTYIVLRSTLKDTQINVRPSPAEVSAFLWVGTNLVRSIVSSVDGEEGVALPPTVSVSQVSGDGAVVQAEVPVSFLSAHAPASGPDVERISTGTRFALDLWLRSLENQMDTPGI